MIHSVIYYYKLNELHKNRIYVYHNNCIYRIQLIIIVINALFKLG